jgi:protein arginine N-methyltransferase 2
MLAAGGGHDPVVELLLEAGTPWNAIDKEGYCAGDHAMLAGHDTTTELLIGAGAAHNVTACQGTAVSDALLSDQHTKSVWLQSCSLPSCLAFCPWLSIGYLACHDQIAVRLPGIRAELVLGALERKVGQASTSAPHEYLQQRLQYDGEERLMDADDKAVMMAWEGCAGSH